MRKFIAISLLVCAGANASACEKYDTPGVTVSGTVTIKTFYGPPNYGENPKTDSREQQAILRLTKPLCTVDSEEDDGEKNEMKITLVPSGKMDLGRFAGKSVRVSGSLFHSFTAHHHTALLLTLTKAPELLDEKPAAGK